MANDPDPELFEASRRRPLRHLLVVAGVRGAGKTTFLRALVAGRIDPTLLARISKSAVNWPQVEGSDHADWMPLVAATAAPVGRLVLHWDLVNFRYGIGEPALRVLQFARKVTVVNIKPHVARLTAQFGARTSLSVARLSAGRMPPEEIWNHVARPLIAPKSVGVPLGDAQMRHLEQMRRSLLSQYSDAGWLDRLYADWDAMVVQLAAGATLRVLEIEPADASGPANLSWRLNG